MHQAEKLNLEQIEAFLRASEEIRFKGETREQVYHWIEQLLRQQQYEQQGRKARGLLRNRLRAISLQLNDHSDRGVGGRQCGTSKDIEALQG